ncbi:MAG: hypothetical protein OXI79_19650 [Gammaproteobacteria bacterium]|nr:hypothetical protein [Gammaproteobacteria bacterium]
MRKTLLALAAVVVAVTGAGAVAVAQDTDPPTPAERLEAVERKVNRLDNRTVRHGRQITALQDRTATVAANAAQKGHHHAASETDSPGRCQDLGLVVTWHRVEVDDPPQGHSKATWAIIRDVRHDRYLCDGWESELWIHDGTGPKRTYCEDTPAAFTAWAEANGYDAICKIAKDFAANPDKPYVHPADHDGKSDGWWRYHTRVSPD